MAVNRGQVTPIGRSTRSTYVQGNTVRQVQPEPKKQQEIPAIEKKKRSSAQVRRNRRNAMHMNSGYVLFLSGAAVLALVVCVLYLQLKMDVLNRTENVTALQQELAAAKEANTTRYNSIVASVNLEDIRAKAINELGMVYVASDQIIAYQNPESDFVKQYEAIPESGILARSDKADR